MALTKSAKQRAEMSHKAYRMVMPMGRVLHCVRMACGLNAGYISKCMNVSVGEWMEYERNRQPVPGHIIIKLMIFGMDFWARNRESFEGASNDHTVPACAGMTDTDTPSPAVPPLLPEGN